MSYSEYSKCPPLARMQLWRCLRHWSVASSIMLCCIPAQPSIIHWLKSSTSCIFVCIRCCIMPQTLYSTGLRSSNCWAIKNLSRWMQEPHTQGGWLARVPDCPCTVLLKDELIRPDIWQAVTVWQQHIMIIGSIYLDSRTDEYQTGIA